MPLIKPRPGVKIATYTVPAHLPNAPRGILLVPASQWTESHKIISKMDTHKVKRMNPHEAHSTLLRVFDAPNTTNSNLVSDQVTRYATNCAAYAKGSKFIGEFIECFSSKKSILEKMELQHTINNLATRSVNTAVNITEGALSTVEQSTLEVLESRQNEQHGSNDDNKSKDKSRTNDRDMEEEIWSNLVGSAELLVLDSPSLSTPSSPSPIVPLSQYTPEKPKLTMQQLELLDSTCNIAFSNMPASTIPLQLRAVLAQNRDHQLKHTSLKSLPLLYQHIRQLLDDDDDDDNHEDFAFKVWAAEKAARSCKEYTDAPFRFVDLCITDFWGTCFQSSFRQDHERIFWAERIIPFFKYFGVSSNVLFSWCEDHAVAHTDNQKTPGIWNNSTTKLYVDGIGRRNNKEVLIMESSSSFDKEDLNHSLQDSMKLIDIMVSTLNIGISGKLDTKFETVLDMAVFGVQLIRNRLTLLKTTLDPNGKKWQILELRSAVMPTSWSDRIYFLQMFELLI